MRLSFPSLVSRVLILINNEDDRRYRTAAGEQMLAASVFPL